jgi:threonine aldolase
MGRQPPIDLRSDTVTRPTPEMRRAMAEAEVGDDVFGEDPTVNALEAEVAALLGKEAALFVPSGTMANQIALQLHTRPGDSVLCEEASHVFDHEAGGGAALAGVQFDFVPLAEGLSDEAIRVRVRSPDLHAAPTRLLVVENTHNAGRGRALAAADVRRVTALARELGLATHCDGARLWNAAVATGDSERELASGFDTVAVCFSKGLGAPVGSALAGSAEAVARARKLRKRLGGAMRQAGIVAAGALYALRHHRARLAEDHRRAAQLAEGIEALARAGAPLRLDLPERPTNMVYFRVERGDPAAFARRLAEEGLFVFPVGGGWIRAVVHLEIDDEAIARALEILRRVLP